MARPQEFDRDEVLRRSIQLFWSKGYESTSLADLLQATELSKSSLYASFGDKRSLFLEAFDIYCKQRIELLDQILNSEVSARQSIENLIWQIISQGMSSDSSCGCMVANEAVEFGPHDADIQQRVLADFQTVEDRFCQAIARGQDEGSIKSQQDPRSLARFIIVTLQGIQVMTRAHSEQARIADTVHVMLSVLD